MSILIFPILKFLKEIWTKQHFNDNMQGIGLNFPQGRMLRVVMISRENLFFKIEHWSKRND